MTAIMPHGFVTPQLHVRHWRSDLTDPLARDRIEKSLAEILTPPVLEHLPPPLQLGSGRNAVSSWVDARAEESEVLLVRLRDDGRLVGLIILAVDAERGDVPALHIGYLLGEAVWGRGLASEMVSGLVEAASDGAKLRLIGGVDRSNSASARVLRKAGFVIYPELSQAEVDMYVLETG